MDTVCNRLGRGLLGLGVKKGDRLAVLSRNAHAFAALRFAVARGGAGADQLHAQSGRDLPKNPSGKLLKRELRQRFVGGATLDKAVQKSFAT